MAFSPHDCRHGNHLPDNGLDRMSPSRDVGTDIVDAEAACRAGSDSTCHARSVPSVMPAPFPSHGLLTSLRMRPVPNRSGGTHRRPLMRRAMSSTPRNSCYPGSTRRNERAPRRRVPRGSRVRSRERGPAAGRPPHLPVFPAGRMSVVFPG
ncbi:hypothetical protein RAJCM14343_0023 [Rhodococcus aetherivorans]|uniref:Uncharacterized protein n=1 Tax=Rhodococcus aetherivorans TaxID=191292 RepID=A0ABQ0YE30_9NOCA|nr:hypothetical protein RAJCM14343_0023 [Rhodococcus aetherivorans]CCW12362.1 hypothetical protein EBESD8_29110 [Rhodococcus aetherivorans]